MSDTATSNHDQAAAQAKNANRSTTPGSTYFRDYISQGWDARQD